VELAEVYAVEFEAAEAPFAGLAQVFRAAVGPPATGSLPGVSALRGDHEVFRVRVGGGGDPALAHLGSVRVCRV
jgi:hypothetical protein